MIEPLRLISQPDLLGRLRAIKEEGFAYLPGMLDEAQVSTVRRRINALNPIEASFDKYLTEAANGRKEISINNVFNRDKYFLQFLDYPGVIDLAEALHGKDCHIIGMTAWVTGPGRPEQLLHVDWQPLSLPEDVMTDSRVQVPVYITTVHYYLNDLTEELGPTRIVPGSHRAGRPPNGEASWNGVQEQSILCSAGDAFVFRSEIWHRGSANTSTGTRYLLQVHYAQRMISQKFPPYLNRFKFNPAILAKASPRQLRLLGDHCRSNYD